MHSTCVPDPATSEVIGTCPESDVVDVERAIDSASTALPAWKSRTGRARGRILRRWYTLIDENKADLAKLIMMENGKASGDAYGEVDFANSFLEWYSEEAARIYGDIIPHTSSEYRVSVLKEPVGVCGMIVPYVDHQNPTLHTISDSHFFADGIFLLLWWFANSLLP